MNLQNDYKVLYAEVVENEDKKERVFKASTTGLFADATEVARIEMDKYKLVYEKDGKFYGSEKNVPTEKDDCFEAFDEIFVEAEDETETEEPTPEEPKTEEPEEPKVEEPEAEEPTDKGTENGPTYDLPTFDEEDEE